MPPVTELSADPASLRDPRGKVFVYPDRVLRTLTESSYRDFRNVRTLIASLEEGGQVIASEDVDAPQLGAHVIQHPRLTFISYPYEWCFSALRKAAVAHLDLQLTLFEQGFALDDASAFNMQYRGATPVFIDVAAIRSYVQGEYWGGYRQFCEQFLYPILLTSYCRVPYHAWYRGRLSGIDGRDLKRLLPLRSVLSLRALVHVHLHAGLETRMARDGAKAVSREARRPLSARAYRGLITSLRKWVASIPPPPERKTAWTEYETDNSYASEETERKGRFVASFVADRRPAQVVDLGCNSGHFSEVALKAGARDVVGLDGDLGAIERAFVRAESRSLAFLPLYCDLANPSPDQGWRGSERQSLARRLNADAVIALAVVHHMTFGASIPLAAVIEWIVGLAPEGVIEFVPPSDPMVGILTAHRDASHLSYGRDTFVSALSAGAEIVRSETISATGRELFQYRRLTADPR